MATNYEFRNGWTANVSVASVEEDSYSSSASEHSDRAAVAHKGALARKLVDAAQEFELQRPDSSPTSRSDDTQDSTPRHRRPAAAKQSEAPQRSSRQSGSPSRNALIDRPAKSSSNGQKSTTSDVPDVTSSARRRRRTQITQSAAAGELDPALYSPPYSPALKARAAGGLDFEKSKRTSSTTPRREISSRLKGVGDRDKDAVDRTPDSSNWEPFAKVLVDSRHSPLSKGSLNAGSSRVFAAERTEADTYSSGAPHSPPASEEMGSLEPMTAQEEDALEDDSRRFFAPRLKDMRFNTSFVATPPLTDQSSSSSEPNSGRSTESREVAAAPEDGERDRRSQTSYFQARPGILKDESRQSPATEDASNDSKEVLFADEEQDEDESLAILEPGYQRRAVARLLDPSTAAREAAELDRYLYNQESSCKPPFGLNLVAPGSCSDDEEDSPPAPDPLYVATDPRVSWSFNRPDAFYAAREAEIRARGGRKARFGRARESMRARGEAAEPNPSCSGAVAASRDALPAQVAANPAWVHALEELGLVKARQTRKYTFHNANGAAAAGGGGAGGAGAAVAAAAGGAQASSSSASSPGAQGVKRKRGRKKAEPPSLSTSHSFAEGDGDLR